jgi:hypothetical protein
MVKYSEILKETINQEQKEQIEIQLLNYFNVEGRRQVNDNGTVTVFGNCSLRKQNGTYPSKLPIKFSIVFGRFTCYYIDGINTLEGSPNDTNEFLWTGTTITNLIGAPTIVRGDCTLEDNDLLSSLEGCPLQIQGNLTFTGCTNLILDWNGVPNCKVNGTTYIPYHKDLPLLRMLSEDYFDSKIQVGFTSNDALKSVYKIVKSFMLGNTSLVSRKQAIYECQYALIKAGYKGNAKW